MTSRAGHLKSSTHLEIWSGLLSSALKTSRAKRAWSSHANSKSSSLCIRPPTVHQLRPHRTTRHKASLCHSRFHPMSLGRQRLPTSIKLSRRRKAPRPLIKLSHRLKGINRLSLPLSTFNKLRASQQTEQQTIKPQRWACRCSPSFNLTTSRHLPFISQSSRNKSRHSSSNSSLSTSSHSRSPNSLNSFSPSNPSANPIARAPAICPQV